MIEDEMPEACMKCPKAASCVEACGKVECPFKLSESERAKLRLALSAQDDGRHMIPTLSLR